MYICSSVCDCFCFIIKFFSILVCSQSWFFTLSGIWVMGYIYGMAIANNNIIIDLQLTYAIVVVMMHVHVCIITRMAAA